VGQQLVEGYILCPGGFSGSVNAEELAGVEGVFVGLDGATAGELGQDVGDGCG